MFVTSVVRWNLSNKYYYVKLLFNVHDMFNMHTGQSQ